MTEAGSLRRRVSIQQPVDTLNTSGGASRSWQIVPGCSDVPAQIVYPLPSKKGDEVVTQQQKRSSSFTTVTIRYRPSQNISAAMRVVYGTRIFDIRTVIVPDEYPQWITLQCEEIQALGTLHT